MCFIILKIIYATKIQLFLRFSHRKIMEPVPLSKRQDLDVFPFVYFVPILVANYMGSTFFF